MVVVVVQSKFMNSTQQQPKELASKSFEHNCIGGRTITAYLRPNGDYAIRLFLPAGETVVNEKIYAYVGADVSLARKAWRNTVTQWEAMYARYAAEVA